MIRNNTILCDSGSIMAYNGLQLELVRATSKHLQIQGRSAKRIFILQMPRNIVSLFIRFGRRVFQNRTKF